MKNKKLCVFMLMATLMFLMIGMGCKANDDLTSEDVISDKEEGLTEIEGDRVIRIGAISKSPYYKFENGEAEGPVVEVLTEVFNQLNVEFELKPYPWNRMLKMVEEGELDIILDVYMTDERLEYMDFAKEKLVTQRHSFFKLANSEIAFDGDISKLNVKKIGTIRGYYYGEELANAAIEGSVEIFEAADRIENIEQLLNGRVSLIADLLEPCKAAINELGYSEMVEAIGSSIYEAESYVGFSKVRNHTELIDRYDAIVSKIRDEGRIDEIFKKYGFDSN